MRFDLADSLDDHGVVIAVRTAMERQAEQTRPRIVSRQQQPVRAKIVEPDPAAPERLEQATETGAGDSLTGQEVVPLHARIIVRRPDAVDRAER